MQQHESGTSGKTWMWCSGCERKNNPRAVCTYCYLKYDEYAAKQEARRKK